MRNSQHVVCTPQSKHGGNPYARSSINHGLHQERKSSNCDSVSQLTRDTGASNLLLPLTNPALFCFFRWIIFAFSIPVVSMLFAVMAVAGCEFVYIYTDGSESGEGLFMIEDSDSCESASRDSPESWDLSSPYLGTSCSFQPFCSHNRQEYAHPLAFGSSCIHICFDLPSCYFFLPKNS